MQCPPCAQDSLNANKWYFPNFEVFVCAEGAFAALVIQTTLVGVKPTVRIHFSDSGTGIAILAPQASRDVHPIRHNSHGTACGASMAMPSRNKCVRWA